jgi:TolB-like protein
MWTDGMSRAGDDSPGLLGLGIVRDPAKLREQVLRRLSGSLVAALDGTGPRAPGCGSSGRFQPRLRYRSELLERGKTYSVAVVPFRNLSSRRNAGDVVALEFLRALATDTRFQPMEPGVVRASILKNRVVMEGGISVDQVRTLLGSIGADLVLAGDVLSWFDGGVPRVDVNVTMLDGRTGEIVWESGSSSRGDDGVLLFGVGTVGTAGTLSCRVARAAVNEMSHAKASPRPQLALVEASALGRARVRRPETRTRKTCAGQAPVMEISGQKSSSCGATGPRGEARALHTARRSDRPTVKESTRGAARFQTA